MQFIILKNLKPNYRLIKPIADDNVTLAPVEFTT